MLFVSLALVAAGIGLGVLLYRRAGDTDPLQQAQPALFRFLENKMWLDELYANTVVALSKSRRAALRLDGSLRLGWPRPRRSAGTGQLFGGLSAGVDERGINAGVDESVIGTRGLGRLMSGCIPDKFKPIWAPSPSACWRCFFFYAWLA